MATQNKAVLDALTNELVYVPVTADDLAQLAKDNETAAAIAAAKQADKSAILAKLGITADEAAILFG